MRASLSVYVTAVVVAVVSQGLLGLNRVQAASAAFGGSAGAALESGETNANVIVLAKFNNELDVDNSADDIRCYCNLPKCITTGYMCRTARSEAGGCFSEMRENNAKADTRHGCIELLKSDDQRLQCDNTPRKHAVNTHSLLLCCHEDMCNHVDLPTRKLKPNRTADMDDALDKIPTIYANGSPSDKLSNSPSANAPSSSSQPFDRPTSGDIGNSDFLFRMATIFFPICGAIILFVLIAVAMRMLTYDTNSQNVAKLSGAAGANGSGACTRKIPLDYEAYGASHYNQHNPHHLHKHSPPLLPKSQSGSTDIGFHQLSYACHNDLKNETQARKNQLLTLEYSLLPQSCNDSSLKPTNTDAASRRSGASANGDAGSAADATCAGSKLYRNVNLSLAATAKCRDGVSDNKVYEKEALNAVPYWNTATNVRLG